MNYLDKILASHLILDWNEISKKSIVKAIKDVIAFRTCKNCKHFEKSKSKYFLSKCKNSKNNRVTVTRNYTCEQWKEIK